MSQPFVAEIRIFAGNFAPRGWATCDGQILPIAQNTALFSLLGTFYGGNGQTTFALPNLDGSAPMQEGQGPGLSQRFLGESGGEQYVTLLTSEMPAHNHVVKGTGNDGVNFPPTTGVWAVPGADRGLSQYANAGNGTVMSPTAYAIAGASQPHNNMPPFLCLTFIIALQGVYPARP